MKPKNEEEIKTLTRKKGNNKEEKSDIEGRKTTQKIKET